MMRTKSAQSVTSAAKSPTRSKPQRHRQPVETRRALIEAAAKIFNSAGYHGTDSNRIAREAGYAPGTFYVHFPDKLAIFLAVYENWVSAEWSSIEVILKSGGSARAIRRRLSRAVLEHHRKWRTFRASLRALSATDDVVHAARVASRARQIETMSRLIRARNTPRAEPGADARAIADRRSAMRRGRRGRREVFGCPARKRSCGCSTKARAICWATVQPEPLTPFSVLEERGTIAGGTATRRAMSANSRSIARGAIGIIAWPASERANSGSSQTECEQRFLPRQEARARGLRAQSTRSAARV